MANSTGAISADDIPVASEGNNPAGTPPPLRRVTKLVFGFGAVAPGVIKAGFSFFLLIFYSQVVGLDAWF